MNNDVQKKLDTCWKTIAKIADKLHWLSNNSEQNNAAPTTTIAQTRVMIVVFDANPNGIMMKQVAQKLRLTPGAVTQTVDSLVKEGLLERYQTPEDRRAIYLRLSPHGEKLYFHIESALSPLMRKFLTDIPPRDQEVFLNVLEHIATCVDATFKDKTKKIENE